MQEWWEVPRFWEGGECWIIGGGPSLPGQFGMPDEVIRQVKSGEVNATAYSPYMEMLHDRHIIAVNAAYKIGNWIDMMFFGDVSFYKDFHRDMYNFRRLKVTCASNQFRRKPNIKTLRKITGQLRLGLTMERDAVCWNVNSGAAAINLAVHTGVKRIFLLGFDMDCEASDYHWHQFYKHQGVEPPYETHLRPFPHIARKAEEIGVEIVNVNPESKIEAFPKVELKDVI